MNTRDWPVLDMQTWSLGLILLQQESLALMEYPKMKKIIGSGD
ncbi:hypothetical protein [Paenibacillus gallinarum]|nr:hypothetical protein [Paenibacillus gallinarum]